MVDQFENIKIGDMIAYREVGWGGEEVVTNVVKVTPKRFVDSRNNVFKKADGSMVGYIFHDCHLATEEDIAKHKEHERRRFLRSKIIKLASRFDLIDTIPTSELEAIYKILNQYES